MCVCFCFLISIEVVYLQRWHGWCHMKLLPSHRVLCTPYNHAPCHFMQSHVRKVHAYLAVTCHFGQNDRGLLRATAVTLGWNGYQNKSQHRKLTLEKKILPLLLRGFEPATFRSRDRRSSYHRSHSSQSSLHIPVTFSVFWSLFQLLLYPAAIIIFFNVTYAV